MKTVKCVIKIQSISDIITNSSSEEFLCQNNRDITLEQLVNFIKVYHKSHSSNFDGYKDLPDEVKAKYNQISGTGGFINIITYADTETEEYKYYKYEFSELEDPENYIIVDLDWNSNATINWLVENLNAKCI